MTESEQAMKDGFAVDRHCYPWVAYKGSRFYPTEWKYIKTDHECGEFVAQGNDQKRSFEEAAKPLIKWLAENVHPYHSVIVTSSHAEMLEGKPVLRTDKFIKE